MIARRAMQQRRFNTAQGSKGAARRKRRGTGLLLGIALATLLLVALACAGGAPTAAPAPAPQQPAAPAQPAPAAPAPEPQPAPLRAVQPATPPAPKPAAPTASKAPEPKYGGILVMSHRADIPVGWDSMRVASITLDGVAGSIFGDANLVKPCRESIYEACPGLAESWEYTPDFTQWTFKVRDNLRWHDGTPFAAEDAKFWAELAYFGAKVGDKSRAPAIFKESFGDLKKVEVLPNNRLRFTLGKPSPQYLFTLMNPRQKIAHPQHLLKPRLEQGELSIAPQDVGLVGTGPFKVLKYEKGSQVQVRRFDGYWEKDQQGRQLPFLDGIDFAIIRDPAAMDAAFRTGRLDGGARGEGMRLTPERQEGYIRDLGAKVWFTEIKDGSVGGLYFNVLRKGPWQDVRVRKAISFWMDRQAYMKGVQGGWGYISSMLDPDSPFTSPDFMTWPGFNPATRQQDRAEAKRLMAEAGYANGFPMGYMCRRQWLDVCEFHHAQLAGLGIELKLQLVDDAAYTAGCVSLDYDTSRCAGKLVPIPEGTESRFTRHSVSNFASPKHEDRRIDEFYDRLRLATTIDQRVKLWRELERYIILEQVYYVPEPGNISVIPYRSHVKGLFIPGYDVNNTNDFATVWLDK